jgi:hypothetical protein
LPEITISIDGMEGAIEIASDEVIGIVSGADVEFVEDALVLVQVA